MVICFDCDTKTKVILDELLSSQEFSDYSEVLRTAVANFAVLHRRVPKSGSTVIDDRSIVDASDLKASDASRAEAAQQPVAQQRSGSTNVPALFRLDHVPDKPGSLAKVSIAPWERAKKLPVPKWIFGQYNKILPAKVTCRGLAHLLGGKPQGLPLSKVAVKIAEEAAALGDFLAAEDSKYQSRREDALQTGFPRTTVSGGVRVTNSSQLRYANQFVGCEVRKTEVSGLPIDLKLIHCEGPDRLVRLTEPGWQFALLVNPVLDGGERRPGDKFSEQEITLLLKHIVDHVPVEAFAYRTLLSVIRDGANTPDKVNAALQDMDIWWHDRKPTDVTSFLSSQRSGAVSRMADLGLLVRDRQGTRVTYRLTAPGEEFLKRVKSGRR